MLLIQWTERKMFPMNWSNAGTDVFDLTGTMIFFFSISGVRKGIQNFAFLPYMLENNSFVHCRHIRNKISSLIFWLITFRMRIEVAWWQSKNEEKEEELLIQMMMTKTISSIINQSIKRCSTLFCLKVISMLGWHQSQMSPAMRW